MTLPTRDEQGKPKCRVWAFRIWLVSDVVFPFGFLWPQLFWVWGVLLCVSIIAWAAGVRWS